MADGARVYREAFIEGLTPPNAMTVSEWADQNRVLSSKGSSEPGPWRTDRTPYLREPMDVLSIHSPVRRVVLMFGSQMGKTEVILNWLGSIIDLWPGPVLLVQPTLDMAKRLNRQRLEPLLRETPALADRIAPPRSRDAGNTMFLKEFQGGMFVLTGANSGTGLQSMPAAYLAADEVSSYPLEADDKGDPLENAEARTSTFPMGKVLVTSTPGTRGACRITHEFEARSDQRRLAAFMPCCGTYHIIRWREHMQWDTPTSPVWLKCPGCGERVDQHHKSTMLAGAKWTPTAVGDGGITAGFHLPGWYAPAGWTPWEQIRDEFLRAKGDPLLLKGWINKRAAEPWREEAVQEIGADGLLERIKNQPYETGYCPDGVLVLTMAVDVQDSWLEVSVWGFGRGEQSWLIWHQKIDGSPSQSGPWEQVDAIRETAWNCSGGRSLTVKACAVDTGGHFTKEAYEYVRTRERQGVVAIKGSSERASAPLGSGRRIDYDARGDVKKRSVRLYMVGTDALKRTIYSRLKVEMPGPGYVHFGQNGTQQYLEGLTCERLVPKLVKGFQVLEWKKPAGARNEPLDLFVYCLAMLELIKRRYHRGTIWKQLEDALNSGGPLQSNSKPQDRRPPTPRNFATRW